MKKFLLFFLFFLSPFFIKLYPQSYHFKTILTEQGQAIKQVRTMMQDSKGYLWFGSSGGGICRYDGKNYSIFTKKHGLCSDDVNCIAEDSDGAIWFGTATGISKFINGFFFSFPQEAELMKSSVFAIVEDREKNLWFGTTVGAYKYSKGKFKKYSEKDGLTKVFIRSILPDNTGKLWFGTVNGKIFSFENERFSEMNLLAKNKNDFISAERLDASETTDEMVRISENMIWSMFQDSQKNLWIGVDDGLWKGKMEDGKWKMEKTELTGNSFLSICEDRKGNLWFGTGEIGIWKYDGKQFINFDENDGLASNLVYSIIEDREGNMWFGCYGTGVSKLTTLSYEIYNKHNKFPQSFIWTVKEDFSGNIWAGFYQPAISVILNPQDASKKEILNFSTEALVYYIWFENKTTLWVATVKGIEIFYFDRQKKSLKKIRKIDKKDGLAGNIVRYIYKDKNNNLWIATAFGLSVMSGKNYSDYKVIKNYTDKDGLVNNYVFSMMEDRKGNMWFATAGGVSKFDGKNFHNYTSVASDTSKNQLTDKVMLLISAVSEGLANQDVRGIVKDKEGQLWFATGAGISFYDEKNDNFKSITSNEGLSVDRLYFLQYDSLRNLLWVGSAFGLDKFDLGEYKRSGKIIITHPTAYDGFIEVETNTNAVCIDKNQNLWFGTIDGLIKYYPDYIRPKNELEPNTHITSISINRKDTLLHQNASLPYEMNNLAFEFIGISLSMPERVKYKYKIDGFDDDWSPSQEETFAKYSNLPAGNYSFKILASNNDGIWNKEPATFNFSILPPWWQTWWFRTGVIIFVIGVIIFYIKWREKNLRKEKEILEEKVHIRTKELAEQKDVVEEKNKSLEVAYKHIEDKNTLIAAKNKNITDSIRYAQNIQEAILPNDAEIKRALPNHFVYFKPRDIVSGDFYWFHQAPPPPKGGKSPLISPPKREYEDKEESKAPLLGGGGAKLPPSGGGGAFIAVCDCTGHGVPGAFVSMIGNDLLNQSIIEKGIINPGEILTQLNNGVKSVFTREGETQQAQDGMDMVLCTFDKELKMLEFAGANNHIILIQNGELSVINGDKTAIGGDTEVNYTFKSHKIKLKKGDTIYMFSDGYQDQFGGDTDNPQFGKGKKFMKKRLSKLFLSIQDKSIQEQKEIIDKTITDWKGNLEQTDDICVIGIRV